MQRHAITGMLGKGNIVTGRQPVRAKLAGFIHPQTELHQRIAADARVGRFPVGVTLRERPDDLPEKRLLQIEDMQRHPQGTARSLKPRDGIVLRRGFFLEGMEGNHLSRIFTLQGRHRIQAVRPAAYGYGYGHKEILFREWRARDMIPPGAFLAPFIPQDFHWIVKYMRYVFYKEKGGCRRATSPLVKSLWKRGRGRKPFFRKVPPPVHPLI